MKCMITAVSRRKAPPIRHNGFVPPVTATAEFVKRAAREAGFHVAGIAPVRDFPELNYFSAWVADGYAGEMTYLAARDESGELKRASLHAVAGWTKSVVVCAINYNSTHCKSVEATDPGRGWISRYAWSQEDYHDTVMRRLRQVEGALRSHADCETRCYVDTGPLVERVYARHAGIGWIGKNACIINQGLGSWLFLGIILTSLELEPDIPAPDRCGSCTRCLDACPTDAFVAPRELDATRCISYLTIEKRGDIPEGLRMGLGRHVFGCDICQDVCPWNRRAPATDAAEFQPRDTLVNPALEWLAALTEEEFRAVFRGSPVKRAKYQGLRRNTAVAMGNSGDPKFIPMLKRLTEDADPVVSLHARWALGKLERK